MRGVTPDGMAIRRLREDHGWTRPSLAVNAGVSDRVIEKAETNQNIDLESLNAIASALNVGNELLLNKSQPQSMLAQPLNLWKEYPPAIIAAIDTQLNSKPFYKSHVVFLVEVTEAYDDGLSMITHLDYNVTNRTRAPHHWQMQKRIRPGGKALSVRFNSTEVCSDALDFQYGRGLKIPVLLQPEETAAVSFIVQERVRLEDSDLYTSYHPATDLTVKVRNPFHKNVAFDFEPLYFGNIERPRQDSEMEIYFGNGILPFEGVRLHWARGPNYGRRKETTQQE